jgi:hypothetical protein
MLAFRTRSNMVQWWPRCCSVFPLKILHVWLTVTKQIELSRRNMFLKLLKHWICQKEGYIYISPLVWEKAVWDPPTEKPLKLWNSWLWTCQICWCLAQVAAMGSCCERFFFWRAWLAVSIVFWGTFCHLASCILSLSHNVTSFPHRNDSPIWLKKTDVSGLIEVTITPLPLMLSESPSDVFVERPRAVWFSDGACWRCGRRAFFCGLEDALNLKLFYYVGPPR